MLLTRYNRDGVRDASFGADGILIRNEGKATATALQPDGKIIVAGELGPPSARLSVLLRFNPDGTIDSTFGNSGVATNPAGTGVSLAVQQDGKIVVADDPATGNEIRVARFDSNGSADSSFASAGVARASFGSAQVSTRSVLVQPDGRIVLVGALISDPSASSELIFARFMPNGSADTSFGSNGVAAASVDFSHFFASGGVPSSLYETAILQPDGRILAATAGPTGFALIRVKTDGALDTTFGTGGIVETSPLAFTPHLALAPGGKILFAGGGQFSPQGVLARFGPSGALDPSFGTGGTAPIALNPAQEEVALLGFDALGQPLVAGSADYCVSPDAYSCQPFPAAIGILRFEPEGLPDTSFGQNGKVIDFLPLGELDPGATQTAVYSTPLAMLPGTHGDIVLAGDSQAYVGGDLPGGSFALNGLRPNGSLDSAFGADDGRVALAPADPSDPSTFLVGARAALSQPQGRFAFVGTGEAVNGDSGSFELVRFTADGTLDPSFGQNGVTTTHFSSSDVTAVTAAKQPHGQIVVAGNVAGRAMLVRYNRDGSVDTSFGKDGRIATSRLQSVGAVLAQHSGKLVLAGQGSKGSAMVRIGSSGVLDHRFGDHGVRELPLGSRGAANGLLGLAHGRILVYGSDGRHVVLLRYGKGGKPDARFDRRARALKTLDYFPQTGIVAGTQPSGRIVVATTVAGPEVALARCVPNGSLDRTFGSHGVTSVRPPGDGNLGVNALGAAKRLITVAGSVSGDSPGTAGSSSFVARFHG